MVLCRSYSYFNFLHKKVNCLFLVNQLFQVNDLIVCNRLFVTHRAVESSPFLNHFSTSTFTKVENLAKPFRHSHRSQLPNSRKFFKLSRNCVQTTSSEARQPCCFENTRNLQHLKPHHHHLKNLQIPTVTRTFSTATTIPVNFAQKEIKFNQKQTLLKPANQQKEARSSMATSAPHRTNGLGNAGSTPGHTLGTAEAVSTRGKAASHLVWVDCEMTGLQVEEHCILEIACLITDAELKVVDQLEIVVHRDEGVLKNMNEWCIEHHTASGLVDRVRKSSVSIAKADEQLLEFVSKYVSPQTAPLVGNSVYMDRMFIRRELPKFNDYLHYRIIDISSLKELCKMYNKDIYQKLPQKRLKHRGLEDIEDTLEEFKFYKRHFLRVADGVKNEYASAVPYC